VATLPPPNDDLSSLVLRTDFSSDATWSEVSSAIAAPQGDFRAMVTFVNDRRHEGLALESLLSVAGKGSDQTFIFVVDRETITRSDHPVLVVDLYEQPGRTFRVIPAAMWSVQNNLSLGNMAWEEFAEWTDPDGIFRRFPE
jgi:hypothetical protein